MDRKELYRKTGCPEQLFGVRNFQFTDGKAAGMRGIDLYNATGLRMTVLPDRGLDIASLQMRSNS